MVIMILQLTTMLMVQNMIYDEVEDNVDDVDDNSDDVDDYDVYDDDDDDADDYYVDK